MSSVKGQVAQKRCKRVFRAHVRNIAGRSSARLPPHVLRGATAPVTPRRASERQPDPVSVSAAFSTSNAFGIDFKGQRTEPPKRSGRLQLLLH
jgi:hypothetical protein